MKDEKRFVRPKKVGENRANTWIDYWIFQNIPSTIFPSLFYNIFIRYEWIFVNKTFFAVWSA